MCRAPQDPQQTFNACQKCINPHQPTARRLRLPASAPRLLRRARSPRWEAPPRSSGRLLQSPAIPCPRGTGGEEGRRGEAAASGGGATGCSGCSERRRRRWQHPAPCCTRDRAPIGDSRPHLAACQTSALRRPRGGCTLKRAAAEGGADPAADCCLPGELRYCLGEPPAGRCHSPCCGGSSEVGGWLRCRRWQAIGAAIGCAG